MNDTENIPIQDQYDRNYQVCYGCGSHNEEGMQIKSLWDGKEATADYFPKERERGIEGFVYGGLVASLIDCHAIATAAVNAKQAHKLEHMPRYVTGSLHVDYKKPTPLLDKPIHLRSWVEEFSERKAIVALEVSVDGVITVTGEVVAVRIPDTMK